MDNFGNIESYKSGPKKKIIWIFYTSLLSDMRNVFDFHTKTHFISVYNTLYTMHYTNAAVSLPLVSMPTLLLLRLCNNKIARNSLSHAV